MGKFVCSGNKSKRSITELVHPINPSWEGRRILGNQIVSTPSLCVCPHLGGFFSPHPDRWHFRCQLDMSTPMHLETTAAATTKKLVKMLGILVADYLPIFPKFTWRDSATRCYFLNHVVVTRNAVSVGRKTMAPNFVHGFFCHKLKHIL